MDNENTTDNSEIWKDIPNFEEEYQISNLGRVKSVDRYTKFKSETRFVRGRIMKVNESQGLIL